ncbi:hypothetical protein niasHT_035691 [Heterodera trifolii]|uniref:glucuronosyltransferase n=1 Tax=Heterodera trifolii TaxID=157864 RepID=A0ABD2HWB8_9BILA
MFSPPIVRPLPLITFICLLLTLIDHQNALRVLVSAPNLFHSHLHMHSAIADVLVEEGGHDVTLLVSIWDVVSGNPPPVEKTNWTRAQRVIRHFPNDADAQTLRQGIAKMPFANNGIWTNDKDEVFTERTLQLFTELSLTACSALHRSSQLFSTLSNSSSSAPAFDVGIAEWFDFSSLALFHRLGIPTTLITSALPLDSVLARYLGIPMPAYVPIVNKASPEGTKMDIWRRFMNYIDKRRNTQLEQITNTVANSMFGENFPSPQELALRASFLLLNTNEMLDLARPTSNKIKHIGGFLLDSNYPKSAVAKSMAKDPSMPSSAPSVFVSFGSVADPNKMPPQMLRAFLHTFASFPELDFVWRFPTQKGTDDEARCPNGTLFGNKIPANVRLVQWVDQHAILAHPNTRAFVSHCGLNSLNEAATAGVPLLCVPLFGDQNYNAAIVQHHQNGIVLLKKHLNKERLQSALRELVADEKANRYLRNAKVISRKITRAPFRPREIVRKFVEYSAEFGGQFSEMNLEGAKMGEWAQNGLDFLVPLALSMAAFILISVSVIAMVIKKVISRSQRLLLTVRRHDQKGKDD